MSFPIFIEPCDGQFAAVLVGAPTVRVVAPTRSQTIAALKVEIEHRIQIGELLPLEIDAVGVSSRAGKYSTDPSLRQICDHAYEVCDGERRE